MKVNVWDTEVHASVCDKQPCSKDNINIIINNNNSNNNKKNTNLKSNPTASVCSVEEAVCGWAEQVEAATC